MANKEDVIEVLKHVQDPEIHMDVWTLELIRKIELKDSLVDLVMTFTTPLCPYGPMLVEEIKSKIKEIDGIEEVKVEVSFDPPWEPSADLRAALGV